MAKSWIFRSYKADSLMVYPFIHWCLKNEAPPIPRDHRFAKSRSLGLNFIGKRMTVNQRRNRWFLPWIPSWLVPSVSCMSSHPETRFFFWVSSWNQSIVALISTSKTYSYQWYPHFPSFSIVSMKKSPLLFCSMFPGSQVSIKNVHCFH